MNCCWRNITHSHLNRSFLHLYLQFYYISVAVTLLKVRYTYYGVCGPQRKSSNDNIWYIIYRGRPKFVFVTENGDFFFIFRHFMFGRKRHTYFRYFYLSIWTVVFSAVNGNEKVTEAVSAAQLSNNKDQRCVSVKWSMYIYNLSTVPKWDLLGRACWASVSNFFWVWHISWKAVDYILLSYP